MKIQNCNCKSMELARHGEGSMRIFCIYCIQEILDDLLPEIEVKKIS